MVVGVGRRTMPRMVRRAEGTAMSGMRLTFPDLGLEVEIRRHAP